ncbi:PAP2 superfamily protein [compost metagenome]
MDIWNAITRLGDSSLLLPVAVFIFFWLLLRREKAKAGVWLLLFGLAASLVVASKLAFMGWGIGIPEWDFTGISGHSMMAASVLPVLAALLSRSRRLALVLASLGALLAVLVGASRIAIGVHSPAEVYAGLAVGLMASASCLALVRFSLPQLPPLLLGVVLTLSAAQALTGARAPTHQMLERIAAELAGREHPFKRGQWAAPVQPDV